MEKAYGGNTRDRRTSTEGAQLWKKLKLLSQAPMDAWAGK
jgi:hypothetical protein